MSNPNKEVPVEDWKVLTSLDDIVSRMKILSDDGNLPSNLPRKPWKSRLWAAALLYLVAQSCYHIFVTVLVSIFVNTESSGEEWSLLITDHILNSLIHCFVIIKILTFFLQSREIQALVEDLKEVHRAEQFNGEAVKILVLNAQAQANRLYRVLKVTFEASGIMTCTVFLAESISSGKIRNRGWFPVDVESSPGFEITLIFMGTFVFMLPIIIGHLDTFIVCFLYNFASQLNIICHKFEHIKEQAVRNVAEHQKKLRIKNAKDFVVIKFPANSTENLDFSAHFRVEGKSEVNVETNSPDRQPKYTELVDDEMNRLLGALVNHQVVLFRLAQTFEKIFNPALCSQVVANLCMTSLSVFFMIKEGQMSHRVMQLTSFTSLLVSEMLVFCYLADKISTQSTRVRDCAYSCAWLRSSARFSKSLRVVMSMANRELRVRVAGHVPLSMESFAQITKFSWSVVTMAKSLTDPARQQ